MDPLHIKLDIPRLMEINIKLLKLMDNNLIKLLTPQLTDLVNIKLLKLIQVCLIKLHIPNLTDLVNIKVLKPKITIPKLIILINKDCF